MLRQVLFYQLGAFFSQSGEQREHKADMVVRHAVVCEASDAVLAHPAPQTQCAFPEDDLLPVGIDGAPRRRRFLRRADEQSSVLVHKLVFGAESPVGFGGAARFQPATIRSRPSCASVLSAKGHSAVASSALSKLNASKSAPALPVRGSCRNRGDSVAPANDRLFRTSTDGVKESLLSKSVISAG